MKYYIFLDDGAYGKTMTFDELKAGYPEVAQRIMRIHFGCEDVAGADIYRFTAVHQYDSFYELETERTVEQVREVIEHDFYVDWEGLAKVIGHLTEIKI